MHTQPGHLRIHGDWKREVFMFSTTCSGIWKGGDCGQYLRWLHDGMMAWYNQMAKVRKHFFWLISICWDSGPSKLQISAGQPSHLPDEGAGFKVQRKRGETRCGIASWNGGSFSGRPWSTGFFPWVSSKAETFFVSLGPECCGLFSPGYIKVGSLVNRAGWYLTVGCIVPTNCKQDWS